MPYLDPVLPVAMLDGMLQTTLLHHTSQNDMLSVPFSIATIRILAPLSEHLFVRVCQQRRAGSSLISYSMTAYSTEGHPLLIMEGAVGRPLVNQASAASSVTRFAQRWQAQPDALPQADYPVLNLYRVSGPFHTPLMAEISEAFADYLGQFHFHPPSVPVIANATGQPYGATNIVENLVRQLTDPVHWQSCIEFIYRQGPMLFIELGAKTVLSKFMNSLFDSYSSLSDDI